MAREGVREDGGRAAAKIGENGVSLIAACMRAKGLTHQALAELAGISINTVDNAIHGKRVLESKAAALSHALEENVSKFFDVTRDTTPLTGKTILEYHRFISTVLAQADKEMLIPYNPAAKATPPIVSPMWFSALRSRERRRRNGGHDFMKKRGNFGIVRLYGAQTAHKKPKSGNLIRGKTKKKNRSTGFVKRFLFWHAKRDSTALRT